MNPEEFLTVALIDDTHKTDRPVGNAIRRIMEELKKFGSRITDIGSFDDTSSSLANLPEADCIFINWNLGGDSTERLQQVHCDRVPAESEKQDYDNSLHGGALIW